MAHKKLTCFIAALGLAVLLAASAASADVMTTNVMTVPPGLQVGDTYRLVFVTAGLERATSTTITDYDAYVTGQALASPDLLALNASWYVLGSTPSVDARSHVFEPFHAGAPIFNLAGQQVAAGENDLWDGSLLNPVGYDQFGAALSEIVFTGSNADGLARDNYELGANGARVQYGRANAVDGNWMSIDWSGSLNSLHFYGISGVLTVVPEPATLTLLTLAAVGLVRRRRP